MKMLVASTVIAWILAVWSAVRVVQGPGAIRRLRRTIDAVVWAGLGSLLGMALVLLHMFHAFSSETLVARVTTARISPERFELAYAPVASGEAPLRVRLSGDQWMVSGGIVKWHPWLTALGLPSYHRPMRLSGQFSDLAQQRRHLPTVYPLQRGLMDRFWEALYWMDPYLPFVEAVYGSSAYAYAEPGVEQQIYVTPSGYLIKRKSRQ